MAATVGQLIKNARLAKNMTQVALGAATRIPKNRISNIECGVVKATPDEIAVLAKLFQSFELVQAYWMESPLWDSLVYICDRMGMRVDIDHLEVTARQFADDIIECATEIKQLYQTLPTGNRQEHILLMGTELKRIEGLVAALRLLVCDIKG